MKNEAAYELDDYTVSFKRSFESSPEEVWRAISSKEGLDQWFMVTELEPHEGGKFSFQDGWNGWIGEWQEGKRIQFNSAENAWTIFQIYPTSNVTIFTLFDRLKPDYLAGDQADPMNFQPGGPGTHTAGLLAGWHDFVDALESHLKGEPIEDHFEDYVVEYTDWLKTRNNISGRIDVLLERSELMFDTFDYEGAEKVCKSALDLAITHELKLKEVDCLSYLGYIHVKELKDYELVRNAYHRCIHILRDQQPQDKNRIASFYYRLGNTHYWSYWHELVSNYQLALEWLEEESYDKAGLSYIHEGLGLAYRELGMFDLSEKHYLEAIEVRQQNNPDASKRKMRGHAVNQLIALYEKTGQEEKADYWRKQLMEAPKRN